MEHGTYLDENAAAAMAEAGTWLVPTLSVTQSDPAAAAPGVPETHRQAVKLALSADVPVAMGTDNPERPHTEVLREIHHMSEAGLGEEAGALRAATWEAARLLNLSDDRGEIAEGKRADLVALDGTSLDVSALDTRIRDIWHNGRRVSTEPAH